MANPSNLPFIHKQGAAAPLHTSRSAVSPEQRQIIDSVERRVLVQGGPGTGKSDALVKFAAVRPTAKGLVLVRDAEELTRMSDLMRVNGVNNFVVHSFRSLALEQIAVHRPEMIPNSGAAWMPWAIIQAYNLPSSQHAGIAFQLLNNFFCTDARAPALSHMHPDDLFHMYAKAQAGEEDAKRALLIANQVWNDMVQGRTPFPEEAYVKLFLTEVMDRDPRASVLPYDHILVDDVHELTPATLRLLNSQRAAVLLALGDQYQRVNQFRAPFNPMDELAEGAATYMLTQSFTLSASVADMASRVVNELLEGRVRLTGVGTQAAAAPRTAARSPEVLIARTIAPLLEAALAVKGKGIYWAGGDEAIQKLVNVYQMSAGRRDLTNIAFYRGFDSFATLESYATGTGDGETLGLIRLVLKYGPELPAVAEATLRNLLESAGGTHCASILVTAHDVTGQTFERVRLAEDFTTCADAVAEIASGALPDEQEVHLLYVAITRARLELTPDSGTQRWLKAPAAGEAGKHEAPVVAAAARAEIQGGARALPFTTR